MDQFSRRLAFRSNAGKSNNPLIRARSTEREIVLHREIEPANWAACACTTREADYSLRSAFRIVVASRRFRMISSVAFFISAIRRHSGLWDEFRYKDKAVHKKLRYIYNFDRIIIIGRNKYEKCCRMKCERYCRSPLLTHLSR